MISPLYVMLDVDNRRLVALPATALSPEAAALAGVLTTTGVGDGIGVARAGGAPPAPQTRQVPG